MKKAVWGAEAHGRGKRNTQESRRPWRELVGGLKDPVLIFWGKLESVFHRPRSGNIVVYSLFPRNFNSPAFGDILFQTRGPQPTQQRLPDLFLPAHTGRGSRLEYASQ